MIMIPFPLFSAIAIVLIIGFTFNFRKYIRLVSAVLYIGFWFSFNARGTPPLLESFFNDSSSVFDKLIDPPLLIVLKPIIYLFGSVLCIGILYACIKFYQNRSQP